MNLIDKDALIEALGIETDCYDCEHETIIYHCDLDPVTVCEKIIQAPVITLTTESAEKAIEVLKNAAWLGAVYSFEETEEAVKTAIRALQAMPTAQSEHNVHDSPKDADCISRQQAIDALNEYFARIGKLKRRGLTKGEKAISLDTVGVIKTMPSAQPQRKKGEWIYNSPVTMKCNQCGLVIKDWDWHRFKYCPNCCSDMRAERRTDE